MIDTAAKQHAAGALEAVNRNPVLLQQKYFVDICGQYRGLAETQLQDQRHEGFVDLAQQAALRGQEQVLGQLLG